MEERHKIHAFYILSILVSIIIVLLTVKWADIPGLKDYISFALTVFSLGLAILAIIYSMYSNTTLSSSLNLLENSSHKLANTSDSLSSSTKQLSDSIRKIPDAIEKVETRVSETHDLVKNLELNSSPSFAQGSVSTEFSNESIENFIDNMSYNGLLTLYLLNFSFRHKTPIRFDKEVLGRMDVQADYNFACYIVMKSIGLFKTRWIESAYLVTNFHPYLDSILDQAIQNKIDNLYNHDGNENYDEDTCETREAFYKFQKYLETTFGSGV